MKGGGQRTDERREMMMERERERVRERPKEWLMLFACLQDTLRMCQEILECEFSISIFEVAEMMYNMGESKGHQRSVHCSRGTLKFALLKIGRAHV